MAVKLGYMNITKQIDKELGIWRENQKAAITDFDFVEEISVFNNMPNAFKAATWFGLGMTAAEKLTPFTAVATLASRTAGPLAILKLAGDYFVNEYAAEMKQNRLQLASDASHYKNKLRDTIDQASRNFYNPGVYGDMLVKKLLEISENDVFEDERAVAQLLRRVLVDSKVLVNGNAIISHQTREAMGELAKVTEAIYRGSKYAKTSGVHILKVSNNSGPFGADDFKHSECHVGKHLLATSKKGEKVGFFRETKMAPRHLVVHPQGDKFDYIDSDAVLNEVLLNAWRYDAKYDEGGFFSGYYQCKTTWLWPAKDATEHLDLNKTYRGSLYDVENNYKKLRSQYLV